MNVPVTLCDAKLVFHISEILRVCGSDCASPPHNHGDWELRYITSGTGNQVIGGEEIKTRSGDVLILAPKKTHYQTEESITNNLVQYSIRVAIKNPSLPSSAAIQSVFENTPQLHDDRFTLAPLFNRLWKEISDRKPGYFNYLQSLCLSILIELLRLTECDCGDIFTTDSTKYTSYWHDRLDQFMHKRFQDNIRLEDLSEEIALSPRHASRMVVKEYGMSFIQKLTEIRLDNAKYMLKYTKRDMEAISASCGFQSYSYFTTCFKKNVGMTPGQYRSKFKSKE